ncbi:MAG: hypothetical protein DHS20C15_01340 [Planctomycetota bacterium]|nr:MAG: hypothetical protein DHS20C15_01340 [Planctomycetota bacterium]
MRCVATILLIASFALPASAQTVLEELLLPGALPAPPGADVDFGYSVDLSDDLLVVGAPEAASGEGRLYLYTREGVDWVFDQALGVSLPSAANASLGRAVALDGDRLAATSSGSLVIFELTGGSWQQQAELATAPLAHARGLDLGGGFAVIAEPAADHRVLVFRDNGGWSFEDTLSGGFGDDALGVAVSADALFIGREFSAVLGNESTQQSVLTVYERQLDAWVQVPFDGGGFTQTRLGDAVEIDGDRAVASGFSTTTQLFPPAPGVSAYRVSLFTRTGGAWALDEHLPASPVTRPSAAFAGDDVVAVGRDAVSEPLAAFALFRNSGAGWSLEQSALLDPNVEAPFSLGGPTSAVPDWSVAGQAGHFVAASRAFDPGTTGDGAAFVWRTSPFGVIEGGQLAGTAGVTPELRGTGSLAGGSATTITLTDALPSSTTALLSGTAAAYQPFKGGVLVPLPNLLVNSLLALPVNAAGERALGFHWPHGVPAGVALYLQHWVVDAAAPYGYSASNGLELISQ